MSRGEMRKVKWLFARLGVFFLFVSVAEARVLGPSARQMSPGSFKTLIFYQGLQQQDLNFKLTGSGTCTSAPPSTVSFPCGSSGNVAGEGDGGAMMLKLIYQPWENLQYYASFGMGNYSLRVASISVVNSLTGDRPGFFYAAGIKSVLVPDTVVTPAIALDVSLGGQQHFFNELRPAVTASEGQINQRLDVLETQVAVEASHLFKFNHERWRGIEPYGGLRWMRSQAWLKDLRGGGRIGGIQDTVTPFLGLQIPIFDHEGLFAETSFIGGYQYAAGLSIRFK